MPLFPPLMMAVVASEQNLSGRRTSSSPAQTGLLFLVIAALVLPTSAIGWRWDVPATPWWVVEAAAVDPRCAGPERYFIADGRDYRGSVNVTATGIACQSWGAQTPHHHDTPFPDALAGIGNHNYCRNPNGMSGPGCYTINPAIPYQLCDVGPPCQMTSAPDASVDFVPRSGSTVPPNAFVSVSCFPRPCEIYFTTDGSEPSTTSSPRYSLPVAVSPAGEEPLAPRRFLLRTMTRFPSGRYVNRNATFFVQPSTEAMRHVRFRPPLDGVVYPGPVLVSLSGLDESSDSGAALPAVVFLNDSLVPVTYTGPFWLSRTTTVTAVINGTDVVSATCTIHDTTERSVVVFPESGERLLGGANVLVFPDGGASTVYAVRRYACTSSAEDEPAVADEWAVLDARTMLFTVVGDGFCTVTVRATYFSSLVLHRNLTYHIIAAGPPQLSPEPVGPFHTAVRARCTNPRGDALDVLWDDAVPDSSGSWMDESEDGLPPSRYVVDPAAGSGGDNRKSVLLRQPGTFSVSCAYTDHLGVRHEVTAAYILSPLPMTLATASPCGRSFPPVDLYVELFVAAAYSPVNDSSVQLYLNAAASDGAISQRHWFDGGRGVEYFFSPGLLRGSDVRDIFLRFTVSSSDPMELQSAETVCAIRVVPRGTWATPYLRAVLTESFAVLARSLAGEVNATADAVQQPYEAVASEVIDVLLSRCLFFANATDYVTVVVIGPFFLLRVAELPAEVVGDFYAALSLCAQRFTASESAPSAQERHNNTISAVFNPTVAGTAPALSVPVALRNVTTMFKSTLNQTSGFFLAEEWQVNVTDRNGKMRPVVSEEPVSVTVRGWLLDEASYRFVRSEFTCDDIGVRPAVVSWVTGAAAPQPYETMRMAAVFSVSFAEPGTYKLCAVAPDDTVYVVPMHRSADASSSADDLDEAKVTLGDPHGVITVVPKPWLELLPSPCGGPVPGDAARRAAPLAPWIHVNVTARVPPFMRVDGLVYPAYSSLHYSRDASAGWGALLFPPPAEISVDSDATLVLQLPTSALSGAVASTNSTTAAMSLGAQSGAAGVCVFYLGGAPSWGNLTYDFTNVANATDSAAAVPEGLPLATVRLVLNGDFGGDAAEPLVTWAVTNASALAAAAALDATLPLDGGRVHDGATVFRSASTSNATHSVAEQVFAMQPSLDPSILTVHVVVDGVPRGPVAPSLVALSPLSLAMYPCGAKLAPAAEVDAARACLRISPWCVDDPRVEVGNRSQPSTQCVCIGPLNKTAYVCAQPDVKVPQTSHRALERLVFFMTYLLLIGLLALLMYYAVRRGAALRREQQQAVEH